MSGYEGPNDGLVVLATSFTLTSTTDGAQDWVQLKQIPRHGIVAILDVTAAATLATGSLDVRVDTHFPGTRNDRSATIFNMASATGLVSARTFYSTLNLNSMDTSLNNDTRHDFLNTVTGQDHPITGPEVRCVYTVTGGSSWDVDCYLFAY